jgi:hypothetical protein
MLENIQVVAAKDEANYVKTVEADEPNIKQMA